MAVVIRRVEAPVSNYYGSPALIIMSDGTFRFDVEDYGGWDDEAPSVSQEFAEAWLREFKDPTEARERALLAELEAKYE